MLRSSEFYPAHGLGNRHIQTLLPSITRFGAPELKLTRETVELQDGDFLHADWAPVHDWSPNSPIVVVMHGLESSAHSAYAKHLLKAVHERGWRGTVMHFRGCSGVPNRLARSYHAGETEDPAEFFESLRRRWPKAPLAAVGYSLGGNVLLKYLGEGRSNTLLNSAVAVSVPFDLADAATAVSRGFARLYQRVLMRSMREKIRAKFTGSTPPFDLKRALESKTFWEFDDRVTAPLHGFEDVHDYYEKSSCRRYLRYVRIPTLILHAVDDPFMSSAAVPRPEDLSPAVDMEVSTRGGHVGFIAGPWRPRFWLAGRIVEYLGGTFNR